LFGLVSRTLKNALNAFVSLLGKRISHEDLHAKPTNCQKNSPDLSIGDYFIFKVL
jgi:hypothetical protein